MGLRAMRLGFAVLWLAVAGFLFFRGRLAPGGGLGGDDLGGLIALTLAGWNFVRWYAARRPGDISPIRTRRRPLEPRRDPDRPAEYHPEFDFTRQDPPASGG